MTLNLKGRPFLTLRDFTGDEIRYLLQLSHGVKAKKNAGDRTHLMPGLSIALIFEKPSTRTRCAFVVACNDEGAFPEYLGRAEIQLGKKESVKDTARVLGRFFDGIQYRGFSQEAVETLAEYSGVPVWNGLTDLYHPTQILADFLTVEERFGRLDGIRLAYLGDGRNNMANSLMIGGAKLGMDVRVVAPDSLHPSDEIRQYCENEAQASGGKITVTADLAAGTADADVLYTDVWASMGEEDLIGERIALLGDYRITPEVMAGTGNPKTIFLHCLPAFHNLETEVARKYPGIREVSEEVFEGPQSLVFDQAENRLHTIKAVMVASLADPDALSPYVSG